MPIFRPACGFALLLGMLCAAASADVFYLSNGGQISGQLMNAGQSPRETYDVRTNDGARLRLTTSQVRKFVPLGEAARHYKALLPRMPASAEGNWTMAEWCLSQGLDDQREHHLHEVLRLDGNHRDARLALGYTSLRGEWIKTDEWNRRQGYVSHQGKWRTPQEVALLKEQEHWNDLQGSWKPKLKRWRTQLGKRDARTVQTALASIKAIKDPLAGEALAEMYDDEESILARKIWVEALGQNASVAASDALVRAAIEDEDPGVRDKARDQLAERSDGRAIGALLAELKSKDNNKVNRAAGALALIKDPETFLPLIEALVTEHQYVTGGPAGQTSATFSPNGGGGLSAGGGPKLIKRNVANRSVLSALVSIVQQEHDQHANFQYDKEKWKEWYAAKTTPKDVNFRRDP